MTSKISFSKLLKENLRRRPGMLALTAVYTFFGILYYIIQIQNAMAYDGWTRAEVYDVVLASIGFTELSIPCALLGVAAAVSGFVYLHSAKKTDFYHSLPVRRREFFRVIVTGSFLVFGVFLLAAAVIELAITAALGYCTVEALANLLLGVVCYLLTYASAFFTAALAMILTGHIVVGILGTGVFIVWAPVLLKCMVGNFQQIFFDTFVSPPRLLNLLDYGSPVYRMVLYGGGKSSVYTLRRLTEGITWQQVVPAAVVCLWIVVLVFLCRKLFEIRPSEAAGNAMAFPKINPVIRVLLVIPLASFTGYYLYSLTLSASKIWVFIGVAIGAVLFHGVIECIFQFDVHGLWSHRRQMLATAAVALCLTATFYLDIYGYDTYVSKAEQVNSVMLEENHFSGRQSFFWGESEHGVSGKEKEEILSLLRAALNKDPEGDAAADTTKVDGYYEEAEENGVVVAQYYSNYNGMDLSDSQGDKFVQVTYYMKDGRQIQRNFPLDTVSANEVLDVAFRSESYRKSLYSLYTADRDKVESIAWNNQISTMPLALTEKERNELLDIYLSELDTLTYEQMRTVVPSGELTVFHDTDVYNVPSEDYYYIYPTFTKTIEYLEGKGCPARETLADVNITQIDFYDYRKEDSVEQTIKDPERIEQIKSHLQPTASNYSIGATGYEGDDYINYNIEVTFHNRYGESVLSVVTDEEGLRLLENGEGSQEQAE